MKKMGIYAVVLGLLLALAGCSETEITLREKTYRAEEDVSAVEIDARDRKIEVVATEDSAVQIDYYESDTEYFDINLTEDGVLTMAAKADKELTDYVGGNAETDKRIITLHVPRRTLAAIRLATTNEDIVLPELTLEKGLTVSNNNGNIEFEKLDVGETVELEAKNGDITGTIAGGWDDFSITCESKKGDSNLPEQKDGGEKILRVSANNGDVEIDFA